MLDKLTHDNYHDFNQRYSGCYGWFIKENKDKILVQITRVREDRVDFVDASNNVFHVFSDSDFYFEFLPLNRQWIVTENHGPMLVMRIPARQWRRGMHPQNTGLWAFNDYGGLYQCSLEMSVVNELVNSQHSYSMSEGPTKNKAFVLSKHFAISQYGTKSSVYFYNRIIGTYTNKNNKPVIKLDNDCDVYQEVCDAVRRHPHFNAEVIND